MKVFLTYSGNGYAISREKSFSGLEIDINITRVPRLFSFVKGREGKKCGVLVANTDSNSIHNIVNAIKYYPDYHFGMIEEVLKEAGISVSTPDIDYIYL